LRDFKNIVAVWDMEIFKGICDFEDFGLLNEFLSLENLEYLKDLLSLKNFVYFEVRNCGGLEKVCNFEEFRLFEGVSKFGGV
jgi:hypothetical protein